MKLKNLVQIVGGGTPNRKKKEYWDGSIHWITVKDFKTNVITTSEEMITDRGLQQSSAKLIPSGNVIMPTRMSLGKVAINKIDVAINQDLKAILITDEKLIDRQFLLYFLKSKEDYFKDRGKGATVKGITIDIINNLEINLPTLKDQKKIVQILDQAQSLIDKRKEQIALLDQLTQSVFLDMFGDPMLSKYERRALQEIADVRDGTHDSPKYQEKGYPLVTSKNIKNGVIDLSNANYISLEDFKRINKRSKVDVGDIIMPMIGTIGNPVIIKKFPNFAIKNVALIKFNNKKLNNMYLLFLLQSHYFEYMLRGNKRGGTQKFLSLGNIRNLHIPLPPIEMQYAFENNVIKIEQHKNILTQSLSQLQNLYNSLMQRAFRGDLFNSHQEHNTEEESSFV